MARLDRALPRAIGAFRVCFLNSSVGVSSHPDPGSCSLLFNFTQQTLTSAYWVPGFRGCNGKTLLGQGSPTGCCDSTGGSLDCVPGEALMISGHSGLGLEG